MKKLGKLWQWIKDQIVMEGPEWWDHPVLITGSVSRTTFWIGQEEVSQEEWIETMHIHGMASK